MESLGAAAVQSTLTGTLADCDGSLSDGKDTDEEGFSGL